MSLILFTEPVCNLCRNPDVAIVVRTMRDLLERLTPSEPYASIYTRHYRLLLPRYTEIIHHETDNKVELLLATHEVALVSY